MATDYAAEGTSSGRSQAHSSDSTIVLGNHKMKRTVIAAALAASIAISLPLLSAAGQSSGNDTDAW